MRRAPDDGPVISAATGDDEELGPLPGPSWPRRLVVFALGAGLAVAGLLTVHERGRPAVPPPPVARSSSAPDRLGAPDPLDMGLQVALGSSPERCPVTIDCASGRLPGAVVAALHRLLPRAVVRSKIAVTQTNPPRIYFRQVRAGDGSTDVVVRIVRSNILDGLEATERVWTSPTRSFAFVRVITSDEYEVAVELSVPLARSSPLALARRLAADSALLAL